MSKPDLAARRENILGEGVCWDPRRARLFWVDIVGGRVEWLQPDSGQAGGWTLDLKPSAIAPMADGRLLLGTNLGLVAFDPDTGAAEHVLELEPDRPANRSNDGGTDRQGRFWLGTMSDGGAETSGALYRVDRDWTVTRMADGLGIPNTIQVSPDGGTLYVADSFEHVIWGYDLNPSTGALGYRHLFAETKGQAATPDGSAVDTEGCLWNAQWGGSRLVRYTPEGLIDRVVDLPVSQPTKCAFGGPDLDRLYVTSARDGLSEEQLAQEPLAGSLFVLDPGVRGLPQVPFGA
ncbi:MAG: SMP-30/gluconolactonase/LRE family protein [Proteobacteria bacterium]|nr:SMP-30/gluconolactonase/LRE family protein [Pseudomonadota bacterium]